ncbi:hypothetical protein AX14_001478 [Amanita brunnescens Koide BX004]|nr:hypothetical protein AX14_001478 [Amanita brunnescens Koide BX004]
MFEEFVDKPYEYAKNAIFHVWRKFGHDDHDRFPFFAMMEHPEVLAKAQREIDALLYVEAIFQELLHWAMPLPLGMPWRLIQDDVFTNSWAITRDEKLYPDSFKFDPERFIGSNTDVLERRKNIREQIFGFGRRHCPGKHLADSSIWLLITCMMATLRTWQYHRATSHIQQFYFPDALSI